jgi:hypothetical protein
MSPPNNAAGPFRRRIYIPEDRLERTCQEALASVELLPESPGPVRIDRFIFLNFGIEEEYEELPAHIMGCAKFTRRGLSRIIVNRELAEESDRVSRVRVRSTLSHEAGHGLFHTPLFIEKLECEALERVFDDGDGVFDSVTEEGFMCRAEAGLAEVPKFEWWEYQANLAMAALLLPKPLIVEAARKHLSRVFAGPGNVDARRTDAERELAELFDVSRKMVSIRLAKWWRDESRQPSLF